MSRVFHRSSLVVCLTVAVGASGAPRGLLLAALAAGIGIVRTLHAQQLGPASLRRGIDQTQYVCEQGGKNGGIPAWYSGINVTVRRIIALAYQPMPDGQIDEGPAWIRSERYDVQARFTGTPSRPQLQQMLRAMLADRFKLKTHAESRPTPVFALTVLKSGRLGPGLQRSPLDCSNPAQRPAPTAGVPSCAFQYTDGLIRGRGVTLDQIAAELTAGRTVVNRSGLIGFYDVELRWTPDGTQPPSDDAPPALATALREQLGLSIHATTIPLEHLVIDSVERPAETDIPGAAIAHPAGLGDGPPVPAFASRTPAQCRGKLRPDSVSQRSLVDACIDRIRGGPVWRGNVEKPLSSTQSSRWRWRYQLRAAAALSRRR